MVWVLCSRLFCTSEVAQKPSFQNAGSPKALWLHFWLISCSFVDFCLDVMPCRHLIFWSHRERTWRHKITLDTTPWTYAIQILGHKKFLQSLLYSCCNFFASYGDTSKGLTLLKSCEMSMTGISWKACCPVGSIDTDAVKSMSRQTQMQESCLSTWSSRSMLPNSLTTHGSVVAPCTPQQLFVVEEDKSMPLPFNNFDRSFYCEWHE